MDAIAALRYDGYSYRDQTISELSAVDAPTRAFWLWLVVPYEALVFSLALGVFSAARRRAVGLIGWFVFVFALTGIAWPFAPMHQREVLAAGGGTTSDTMHLVLAGVTSVCFMGMTIAASVAFRGRFRLYSIATIAGLLVFGSLISVGSVGVADNEQTSWLGIYERINVFGAMLWMGVFGLKLRRDLDPLRA